MNVKNFEQILSKAGCTPAVCSAWAPYFAKHCTEGKINTAKRVAAFLANLMVESNYLRTLRENLNYSAAGLAKTWPKRYANSNGTPNAKALSIARNPEKIANHCYANRMGNGGEETGDGWKYAGKGPIQITGKKNTHSFFKDCGLPIDTDPNRLTEPDLGVQSAVWFWNTNNISPFADKNDFDGTCDKINLGHKTDKVGDAHGYKDRRAVYDKLMAFLKVNPKIMEGEVEDTKPTVVVVPKEKMEFNIAPDIVRKELDPLGEFKYDTVESFTPL